MRIQRDPSNLSFRRRSANGGGCLILLVTLGIFISAGALARNWIRQWVSLWWQKPVSSVTLHDAQMAFARGDLELAEAYSQQLLENSAENQEALVLLVRTLVYKSYSEINRERDRQRGLMISTKAVHRFPLEPMVLGIHAFALQANGDSDEATRIALSAIRRDPDNVPARIALALAYGNQGIFQASIRESQRAVEITRSLSSSDWRADAYRALAISYSDMGRYTEAAQAIEQALVYHQALIPLHFEGALYAMQVSATDTATAYYFNVIALDEDNIKARYRLCELSSSLREHQAAISYCSDVIQRAPGWSEAWYTLGREYFLQGRFHQAQQALNRCSTLQIAQDIPIGERRFECWYIQGQAAELLGDCPSLMSLYNEFQEFSRHLDTEQTWVYPPGGPPSCITPIPIPQG